MLATARTMSTTRVDLVRSAMVVPAVLVLAPIPFLDDDGGLTQALPVLVLGAVLVGLFVAASATTVTQLDLDERGIRARRLLAPAVTVPRSGIVGVVVAESLMIPRRVGEARRRRVVFVDEQGAAVLVATWDAPGFDVDAFVSPWGLVPARFHAPMRPALLDERAAGSAIGLERPGRAAGIVCGVVAALAVVIVAPAVVLLRLA